MSRLRHRVDRLHEIQTRPHPAIATGRPGETAEQLELRFRDEHGDAWSPVILFVQPPTNTDDTQESSSDDQREGRSTEGDKQTEEGAQMAARLR